MATLGYLWRNRAVYPVASKSFVKVWAKRLLSMPELLRRNSLRNRLVRKGAVIAATAEIGEVVYDGDGKYLSVDEFATIGRVHIAAYTGIKIGKRVCINDGVKILTASHDVTDPEWKHVKGEIVIDDYAWIGTNALILPGVKIGYGAVVGAGAVVSKSVESHSIVVGNPAKPISKKRTPDLNYNPCEFLAANRAWLVG